MQRQLRKGALVELMVDANPIPAGRYRFLEQDGEMLIFSVGPEILIGINSSFWRHFVRPVFDASAKRTTSRDFIERYYDNVATLRGVSAPFCPDQFTFCIVSPRYYRMVTGAMHKPRCERALT